MEAIDLPNVFVGEGATNYMASVGRSASQLQHNNSQRKDEGTMDGLSHNTRSSVPGNFAKDTKLLELWLFHVVIFASLTQWVGRAVTGL